MAAQIATHAPAALRKRLPCVLIYLIVGKEPRAERGLGEEISATPWPKVAPLSAPRTGCQGDSPINPGVYFRLPQA